MRNHFLVLPGCDDSNRGDQALIWETVRLAKDAGFDGEYHMIATEEGSQQSKSQGINRLSYILPHPSQKTKRNNNIQYGLLLKIKWGILSSHYLLSSLLVLNPLFRRIFKFLLSNERKQSLYMFSNAKAAFVKGGGFLHSYGSLIDSFKIFFFLYHINLALSYNLPVYVMPNSFGPFKGFFVKKMIKRTLKKCNFVSSRESISNQSLYDICGVESFVTNDLAVYLEKDMTFNPIDELIKSDVPIGKKKCVAITLRPYRFPEKTNSSQLYENYKKSIVDFSIWLDNNNFYPVFVEHVYSSSNHEQDMICINEVIEQLPENVIFSVYSNRNLNCKQMKSIYSSFDYMIGTRFHSVIFSLMEEIPSIAITYGGNKGQGIMKDAGLSNYAIDISSISGEKLISIFNNLLDEEDNVSNKLKYIKGKLDNDRQILIEKVESSK